MKNNSLNPFANIFTYILIKRHTSEEAPASQQTISNLLFDNYKIKLDQQDLRMVLYTLEEDDYNIKHGPDGWYAA